MGAVAVSNYRHGAGNLTGIAFAAQVNITPGGAPDGIPPAVSAAAPITYHWTWYDQRSPGALNWVLIANPGTASTTPALSLTIAGAGRDLAPFGGPALPPGSALTPSFPGVIGGPVSLTSQDGSPLITSQRTLWHGDSLEEIPGIDSERLSDRYYWSWYDQASPGFSDWILIANPGMSRVYYRINIAGVMREEGAIEPGRNVTPSFPGLIGGPVEVQAWSDAVGGVSPADVIASQRVLTDFGAAFNEVPGTPVSELTSSYLWTWYDNRTAGAIDWVLVANPGSERVYYEISIAGTTRASGSLEPGENVTPTFPGVMGGPVEVNAWSDRIGGSVLADVIASQRSIWGHSFEELPGMPASRMASWYHWTWYDQRSPAALNWVLVSNPGGVSPVFYEVRVAGTRRASGTLAPGASATPSFPNIMGGPVDVRGYTGSDRSTPAPLIASQRVLWSGHFNEVMGISLGMDAPPQAPDTDTVFPADNIWNTPVDTLPLDPNSTLYVNTIGAGDYVHPDFGSGLWDGGPIGIPFVEVSGSQPRVPVSFYYPDESDAGPYPLPPDAPIEGGPDATGDRHIIVIDRDAGVLYEVYDAWPQPDGSWEAGSGAVWSLDSNALRPAGWTSADAAGLPIYPGLVRYDEVAAGEIRHAIRFTAPETRDEYTWPARHLASDLSGVQYPPMGQRFRLKAGVDISGYSPEAQVILTAMKRYGIILADNGAPWYIGGSPDERWNNDELHMLQNLRGSDFEAVDVSSLMLDPDSGATTP